MTSSCQRSACRTGLRPQQLGWIIVAHRPPREECCGNLICPEFARERSTLRLGRCRPHGTQYRLVIPLGNTDHQAPHMPLVLASSMYPFPPLVNPSTWFTYSCQRILLLHTLARLEAYGIYFSVPSTPDHFSLSRCAIGIDWTGQTTRDPQIQTSTLSRKHCPPTSDITLYIRSNFPSSPRVPVHLLRSHHHLFLPFFRL